MDKQAINRAMNEGAKRLALQVRPTEPESWIRLLELAASSPVGWGGAELVSLLTVAYEIGHEDGESSANADFHEDNPVAVQRAREILGLVQDE